MSSVGLRNCSAAFVIQEESSPIAAGTSGDTEMRWLRSWVRAPLIAAPACISCDSNSSMMTAIIFAAVKKSSSACCSSAEDSLPCFFNVTYPFSFFGGFERRIGFDLVKFLIDKAVDMLYGPAPIDIFYAFVGFHVSTSAYHLPPLLSQTWTLIQSPD